MSNKAHNADLVCLRHGTARMADPMQIPGSACASTIVIAAMSGPSPRQGRQPWRAFRTMHLALARTDSRAPAVAREGEVMATFSRSDDLQGAEFVDANLRGARFRKADLAM